MGMQFSDSTNKNGLVELFNDLTKTNSTSYPIGKLTRDINNTLARFAMLAIRSSKKWEWDDTNQADYPIIKIDITSGQQDYSFTNDGSTPTNQILDIQRVECADSGGTFRLLLPYDKSEFGFSLVQSSTTPGTPFRYDKLANGIFLDPKPNYSLSAGLRIYISRTPSYFATTDTTKNAGIPDMFHEYLVYRPAYLYCISNIPKFAPGYLAIVNQLEHEIGLYYSSRDKDEKQRFTIATNSNTSMGGALSGRLGFGAQDSNR